MQTVLMDYIRYNLWANRRLFNWLQPMETDLINREIKSSFPSIFQTSLHLLDAQILWFKRLKGESLDSFPSKHFTGDFNDVVKGILDNSKTFLHFALEQEADYFPSNAYYRTTKGVPFNQPVWQIILHCMNHSTYHRGQIVTICRQLDLDGIPATDYVYYKRNT